MGLVGWLPTYLSWASTWTSKVLRILARRLLFWDKVYSCGYFGGPSSAQEVMPAVPVSASARQYEAECRWFSRSSGNRTRHAWRLGRGACSQKGTSWRPGHNTSRELRLVHKNARIDATSLDGPDYPSSLLLCAPCIVTAGLRIRCVRCARPWRSMDSPEQAFGRSLRYRPAGGCFSLAGGGMLL